MLTAPLLGEMQQYGVNFELTEEQAQLQKLAHEFAEKQVRPVAAHYDEVEEMPWEVLEKAHKLGLMVYTFPEEYGGAGIDSVVTGAIVSEELAWGCAGVATTLGATKLCAIPILLKGTEAQKKKYLSLLSDTSKLRLGAFAITEPEAGSDIASMRTRAQKVRGGYRLSGTKQFITNGGLADVYVVFATVDPARKADGICAFIVEKGFEGVKAGRKEKKMGIRASHTAQVLFDNVFVPEENLLGEEGDGIPIAMETFDRARPEIAACAVGVARAAYEFALDYAIQREQFGRPIAKLQAIRFILADMKTQIKAARLMAWHAGWLLDHDLPATEAASMAKLFAGDMAMKVTEEAVQILGGYGYTRDYPVEKWMRDAKIMQIYEGTSQIQSVTIAQMAVGF